MGFRMNAAAVRSPPTPRCSSLQIWKQRDCCRKPKGRWHCLHRPEREGAGRLAIGCRRNVRSRKRKKPKLRVGMWSVWLQRLIRRIEFDSTFKCSGRQKRGGIVGKKAPAIGFLNNNRRLSSKVAPRAGFEPATCRLTVECSTAELPGIIRSPRSERVIQMPDRFAKRFLTKKCTRLD